MDERILCKGSLEVDETRGRKTSSSGFEKLFNTRRSGHTIVSVKKGK